MKYKKFSFDLFFLASDIALIELLLRRSVEGSVPCPTDIYFSY